jgi:hypothetical protein
LQSTTLAAQEDTPQVYDASGIVPTFLRQLHIEMNSQELTFDTVSNDVEVLIKVHTL